MRNAYRSLTLVAATSVALTVGACSDDTPQRPGAVSSEAHIDPVRANALEVFTSEELVDWVSYVDHVAYFTVVAERELPLETEEEKQAGLIAREATLKIEDIVWSNPRAPELGEELTVDGAIGGWVIRNGEHKRPFSLGGPRIEVGKTYLAGWIYMAEDDAGWGFLNSGAVFEVDDSGRPLSEEHEYTARAEEFIGATPDEISDMLENTAPNPVAEKYNDLDPIARRHAVALSDNPELPGFIKVVGRNNVQATGYVREEDWESLQRQKNPAAHEIPLYDSDGWRDAAMVITGDAVVVDR